MAAVSAETLADVEDVIAATFGRPHYAVTADTLLEEDLRIDALSMAVLVCAVEDQFGIELPDRVAATMRTVGDLAAWVTTAYDAVAARVASPAESVTS